MEGEAKGPKGMVQNDTGCVRTKTAVSSAICDRERTKKRKRK